MTLQLNESVERYKEFYGRNTEQMPKLIAEGRVPLSVAGLMQKRLDSRNASKKVKSSWMDNYFDTGDAVVYHPDGRVKVVLDSQTLREMTPETQRVGRALLLTEDAYNALEGEEFKRGKIGKTGGWLSKKDVKVHPVWRVLARDQALLEDYVDYIFAEAKERFGYDTAMAVYPDSAGDTPKMRAWYISRAVWDGRSYAYGRSCLDGGRGCLLGLAPEVQNASILEKRLVAPTLEQILALGKKHVSDLGKELFEKEVRALY